MSDAIAVAEQRIARSDERHEEDTKTIFGFWVYIMTDCVLFSALFATYAVLHNNTFGGPSGGDIFSAPYVLAETLVLLTSSFTCGLGILAARQKSKALTMLWFGITFLLGLTFLTLEIHEFRNLVHDGDSWRRSGFLSAFFTLVGTHGLHIATGLLWMSVLMTNVWKRGFTRKTLRQLNLLSMFWHFLDIVWIFIFTIVYMLGVAK